MRNKTNDRYIYHVFISMHAGYIKQKRRSEKWRYDYIV